MIFRKQRFGEIFRIAVFFVYRSYYCIKETSMRDQAGLIQGTECFILTMDIL